MLAILFFLYEIIFAFRRLGDRFRLVGKFNNTDLNLWKGE
jgi:hypothetical protein